MSELDTVRQTARAKTRAVNAYRVALQQARDAGHTLAEIAVYAGVTPQGVAKQTTPSTLPGRQTNRNGG